MTFESSQPIMDNAMAKITSQVPIPSIITCKILGSRVPIAAFPFCKCAMNSHSKKAASKPARAGMGIGLVYFFKLIVVMMFFD